MSAITAALSSTLARVHAISSSSPATLVAVSKLKPASDILECYNVGHRDFGENYVQELADKASQLPSDIRWHFIGSLQSNKAKILASLNNLYSVQTVSSIKTADALNRTRQSLNLPQPLNIFLQINTSGESSKSGLSPLPTDANLEEGEDTIPAVVPLAKHIIQSCSSLQLLGLMTIGNPDASYESHDDPNALNPDFESLKQTRQVLVEILTRELGPNSLSSSIPPSSKTESDGGSTGSNSYKWGATESGKLLLSMGMSSDFEAAIKAGSDVVRVGSAIFGEREKKA